MVQPAGAVGAERAGPGEAHELGHGVCVREVLEGTRPPRLGDLPRSRCLHAVKVCTPGIPTGGSSFS